MATAAALVPTDRTVPRGHRARPDLAGDLLAVAWAPGTAPPREIRLRPELHDRLRAQLGPDVVEQGLLGDPAGVPLVVDPRLPACPGYEVLRVAPGGPVRPRAAAA
ncbi:hypothetical protein [Geodermatophilus sp. URMC 62]|uniref:hypothetical protein n=1 Tax=Geodermatophilus sp. URMC 62 TaxID=3423414 RepID=UPI00406C9AC1